MADTLLDSLLRSILQTSPTEEGSGADRLRPPYQAPVLGLSPMTAGASRDLEVGHAQLPAPYQRALKAAPVRQTQVGAFPEGYNIKGQTAAPSGDTPAHLVGDSAQTFLHELVHELQQRSGDTDPKVLREAVARLVAGNKGYGGAADLPEWREKARVKDADLRAQYPESAPPPPLGLLQLFLRALGR